MATTPCMRALVPGYDIFCKYRSTFNVDTVPHRCDNACRICQVRTRAGVISGLDN